MNIQTISQLLGKYYSGESTEEEELTLKRFFKSESLPDEFLAERDIFNYYSETAEIPEPAAGFGNRIISAIDENEKNTALFTTRRSLLTAISAAAGILLLIGSYFLFIRRSEPADTFSDPQIAYAETIKVLYDVSSRLNHGTKALESVAKMQNAASKSIATFNKSANLIDENLKNLDYFQRALIIVNSPLDISIETNSR